VNDDSVRNELLKLIQSADRVKAVDLLREWGDVHGYNRLLVDILEPTLQTVGKAAAAGGEFTFADGYVAARVTEDLMEYAAESLKNTSEQPRLGRVVVIGNIEDDYHALGRRILGIYLNAYGWEVHDLGNDVLAEQFVDMALEVGAKIVGASAMMHTTAMNILKLREEIDRRNLKGKLQLAVGGAIFVVRPELIEAVGGDGTCSNAIYAHELFERLWQMAERS